MAQQLRRDNHYVPIWYQRGFLGGGQSTLSYMDIDPDQKELPSGRVVSGREVQQWPPRRCFRLRDLYITQFGEMLNDEIERYLFGEIDDKGARAVRAFAAGDAVQIHSLFGSFFEYLDAQKLRTPKGLDWIRSKYIGLAQIGLMTEMQGLRTMHCTMWAESVREIVSAENSDVKFLVTDHPVTVYNAACPPESPTCEYPNDPPIEFNGSQTVFALDANHCLILTNLEYAKDPEHVSPTAQRTNARYHGQSLVRTDAFIRTRKLTRNEVVAINYLLKRRARRYVAAADKEWLYPERLYSGDWGAISAILLPRDEFWRFGGEIYVGYADGSTHYQDEFGRTSRRHQYLQKKQRTVAPRPNEPCGCGSGRKYKKCCKNVPIQERPSWVTYSIRERNLMLCRAIVDILGLDDGKTWEDVRRDLNGEQVKHIHEFFGSLWPSDTDIVDLLPRSGGGTLRAVYMGLLDPRTVSINAIGWLTYIDELILPHPFVNPAGIKPEMSPTDSPEKHKEQTLKNVLLLLTLQPFIDAGLVHLVPDPADFNDSLRRTVWQMAKERTVSWQHDERDMKQFEKLHLDDVVRFIRRLPEPSLREYVRQVSSDLDSEGVELVVKAMKAQLADDPLALLQSMPSGNENSQLKIVKGFNPEIALFLAALTGSVVYTDMHSHWRDLNADDSAACASQRNVVWQPVVDAISSLTVPVGLDPDAVMRARQDGRLGDMRKMLSRVAVAVQEDGSGARVSRLAMELKQVGESIQREWPKSELKIAFDGHIELSVSPAGFEPNTVKRLLLTFGRAKDLRRMPLAMLLEVDLTSHDV